MGGNSSRHNSGGSSSFKKDKKRGGSRTSSRNNSPSLSPINPSRGSKRPSLSVTTGGDGGRMVRTVEDAYQIVNSTNTMSLDDYERSRRHNNNHNSEKARNRETSQERKKLKAQMEEDAIKYFVDSEVEKRKLKAQVERIERMQRTYANASQRTGILLFGGPNENGEGEAGGDVGGGVNHAGHSRGIDDNAAHKLAPLREASLRTLSKSQVGGGDESRTLNIPGLERVGTLSPSPAARTPNGSRHEKNNLENNYSKKKGRHLKRDDTPVDDMSAAFRIRRKTSTFKRNRGRPRARSRELIRKPVCSSCIENSNDKKLIPCGHTVCDECYVLIMETGKVCTVCRLTVEGAIEHVDS